MPPCLSRGPGFWSQTGGADSHGVFQTLSIRGSLIDHPSKQKLGGVEWLVQGHPNYLLQFGSLASAFRLNWLFLHRRNLTNVTKGTLVSNYCPLNFQHKSLNNSGLKTNPSCRNNSASRGKRKCVFLYAFPELAASAAQWYWMRLPAPVQVLSRCLWVWIDPHKPFTCLACASSL